jgi:hypothetical protein
MMSPDAAAIAGPSGSGGADVDQRTVRLEVPQDRPKDSSHWTPRTMSYDPRDNP